MGEGAKDGTSANNYFFDLRVAVFYRFAYLPRP